MLTVCRPKTLTLAASTAKPASESAPLVSLEAAGGDDADPILDPKPYCPSPALTLMVKPCSSILTTMAVKEAPIRTNSRSFRAATRNSTVRERGQEVRLRESPDSTEHG